jgi:hypothetical protein
MTPPASQRIQIVVNDATQVSGLLDQPRGSQICVILAHGAGAGMEHPSMGGLARDLTEHGIATLRYQFPYMERSGKRPDPPPLCHATVRAAVSTARQLAPGLRLIAGGRSFGGRMTSQAQAATPLTGVGGLVFFGFPLHPSGKPSIERAAHLSRIKVPMLFLQGTRDMLADLELLQPLIEKLPPATLRVLDGADHSFHVPARSGRSNADVSREMMEAFCEWASSLPQNE